jgi:Rrf2 family nitric oxide-sensitive transcriptional repressor
MRLTRYTDYAFRVLLKAAADPQGLTSIAEVAAIHDISKNHVMKVVNQLAHDGYLRTIRGRGGGFTLARPAEDIRIGDVVRSTEPDLQLADCGSCAVRLGCGLTPVLAMAAFLATLDKYTLADVVRGGAVGLFPLPEQSASRLLSGS